MNTQGSPDISEQFLNKRKRSVISSNRKGRGLGVGGTRWYSNKIGTIKIFKMYIINIIKERKLHQYETINRIL